MQSQAEASSKVLCSFEEFIHDNSMGVSSSDDS